MNKVTFPRRGPVPRFSDLEIVALSLAAKAESIDSEKRLFEYKLQEYRNKILTLFLADNSMTAGRRSQDYVKKSVRDLPVR